MWDVNYHTTRDGERVLISDMTDEHLKNTISLLRKKAKAGVKIVYTSGDLSDADSLYYDEYFIYGQKVLKHFNYKAYIKEAKKRKLIDIK